MKESHESISADEPKRPASMASAEVLEAEFDEQVIKLDAAPLASALALGNS